MEVGGEKATAEHIIYGEYLMCGRGPYFRTEKARLLELLLGHLSMALKEKFTTGEVHYRSTPASTRMTTTTRRGRTTSEPRSPTRGAFPRFVEQTRLGGRKRHGTQTNKQCTPARDTSTKNGARRK